MRHFISTVQSIIVPCIRCSLFGLDLISVVRCIASSSYYTPRTDVRMEMPMRWLSSGVSSRRRISGIAQESGAVGRVYCRMAVQRQTCATTS